MALKRLEADLSIISKLGDNPGADNSLTSDELKETFDKAPNIIKDYLNEYLLLEIEKMVDVEALKDYIIGETLSGIVNSRRIYVGKALDKSLACGDFVIPSGNNFCAQLNDNRTVTVQSGSCIMQGSLIELADDYTVTLSYDSGIGGTYRSDLICLRVTTDSSGSYSAKIIMIGGRESSIGYVDPEYLHGDIGSAAAVRDLPLYRLKMDGISASLETLFSLDRNIQVTLPANGWEGDAAPYAQTVRVFGLTDGRRISICPAYGDVLEDNIALREACANVSYAKQDCGNITFVCLEGKPDSDINVIVEVHT